LFSLARILLIVMIDHEARAHEVNERTYTAWNAHDADAVAAVLIRLAMSGR